MERPAEECCGTCAWLAKTVISDGISPQPMYAIYDETEEYFREHPSDGFYFVTALNSSVPHRLACFRGAANLFKEAEPEGNTSSAWHAVIWRDRHCPKWSQWEPGFDPRQQVAENRSRQFTLAINSIEGRLSRLALRVTVALGLLTLIISVLVMTPDAVGCRTVKNAVGWTGWQIACSSGRTDSAERPPPRAPDLAKPPAEAPEVQPRWP